MKSFLHASVAACALACVAGAAVVGTASAADLARRAPPPPMKAPPPAYVFTWTGFYIGVNGGYGFGKSKWTDLTSAFDVKGGMAGGTLGYNWQYGQFVYGVEGDGDWSAMRGTADPTACGPTCRTRSDFLSTVRGRVGIAMDRFMPYATGGVAIGNLRADVLPGFDGVDQTRTGWTAGGGGEYAFAPNWSVKAEYLFVNLGKTGCSTVCGLAAGNNVGFTSNVVRGGINYHF